MKRISFLSITIALFVLYTNTVCSQGWSQFRGSNRDCRVTGFAAPASWPAEIRQIWKVTVGTGDAGPVLADKKLYLHTRQGENEVILCLDAESGKELWKDTYASGPVTGASTSHPGPRSTPCVSDGRIVTFGVTGILSCLDAATGKVVWRKNNPDNAVPEYFVAASPVIIDGCCIIYTGKKGSGSILCLDLTTGNEKWKWTGEGPSYSSPSVMQLDGKKHLVIFSEKNLLALDLGSGKLLWKIETPLKQWFYNSSSPVINGQVIYFTGQGSGTKALKVEKKGEVYTPKEIWSNSTTGTKWNTPVLRDGFLYGFTDTRKIFCINTADGKTAWIDNATNSDFSTMVDCGSVLIGLPSTGNLIILKPDSKAYTEIARYKVSDKPVFGFPAITGDAIYLKDTETLMMFKF